MRDWDCAGSLDLERLFAVLRGVKGGGGGEGEGEGRVRQGNFEGGDGDGDGVHDPLKSNSGTITRETIARIRAQRNQMPPPTNRQPPPLVIVEGFLLFGRSIPAPLRELFDVKILLRASYGDAKARRERRNGYVTLEGFWRDPEGYFDEVVWPGYVREHGGLVGREGGGYVEGPPGEGGGDGGGGGGGGGMGVWVSDPGWGLEECLEWIVGVVGRVVERSC